MWRSLGYNHVLAARTNMHGLLVPAAGLRVATKFTRKLIRFAQERPNAPILVRSSAAAAAAAAAAVECASNSR
jgi:hypothetical protein